MNLFVKISSFIFFILLFTSLLSPPKALAGDILINEIMYDLEGSDDDREWIEIYNNGSSNIDLTNWRFQEGGTKHTLNSYQGGLIINPGSYAVIVDNPVGFLGDHSGFAGIIIDSSFSLSNTGETLIILEGDLTTVSDEVSYQSSWGAVGTSGSLERKSVGGATNDSGNWQESVSGGTPGAANSSGATPTPSPTPAPTQIPSPSPTATPAPSLTKTPTPTLKLTPSPTSKPTSTPLTEESPKEAQTQIVLGTQNSPIPTPGQEAAQTEGWLKPRKILPYVFIFGGLIFIGGSLFSFVRQRGIEYNNQNEDHNQDSTRNQRIG